METIKFMYFIMNYSQVQLNEMFDCTSAPAHLRNKFQGYIVPGKVNGSEALFKLFYELSRDNQLAIIEYVNTNYTGI